MISLKHRINILKTIYTIGFSCVLCFQHIAQLKINEFSAHKGYTDETGDDCDWIEVINIGTSALELSDYYITDNENNLYKWHFPQEEIAPMELKLICASGKDKNYRARHWESFVLADNQWRYFPGSSAPPSNWNHLGFNDQSWNIGQGGFGYSDNDDNTNVSGVLSVYLRKVFTINDLNEIAYLILHADYDDAFVAYLNGTEIMRSNNINGFPPSFNSTPTSDHEALLYQGIIPESITLNKTELDSLLIQGDNILAIQVHNVSMTSSDMSSNFFLSAGINSDLYNYQSTPSWFTGFNSNYHTNFKLSPSEKIIISDQFGTIIDSTTIDPNISSGISKGRSPDGIGNWCFFNNPSPENLNGNSWCYNGIASSPNISLPSGWYNGQQYVVVTNNPQSQVHYTTNGDLPSNTDQTYTDTLYFNSTTVFSARAFSSNNVLPSKVVDRTYIFNENNHELPVFSIITDYLNLWDWNTGIYVSGPNAANNYPYFGSNFWQPWSKWSRLEYFDQNKNKHVEAEFDLEIHGGWSRAEPQKSFRIDFKSIYTGDFVFPLIPQKSHIQNFNNFNLRNGGQHTWSDKIQDGLISQLAHETNVDNMAYQPCILYLNGTYWGIYGIREKIDEHYVENNYQIPADSVDLLNSNGVLAGSDLHAIETYDLIMNTSSFGPTFYELAESRFDLKNYIDYFIIQTYIQNMDWLGIAWGANNIKLWRPQTTDGRWRYVLYDTDAAFGYFGQNENENYLNYARNPQAFNNHSAIFDKMLQNYQFKCEFANRYADLINTIFQPANFSNKATSIKNEMYDAIPDHIVRWSNSGTNTISSLSQWSSDINSIVQYNTNRINPARMHVNQELGLSGEMDVNLDVYPQNSGVINISTITPSSYPWNGVYFNGCPINISALADSGYTFTHWDNHPLIGNQINEQHLNLTINQNVDFVANFISCNELINVSIEEENNLLIANVHGASGFQNFQWYSNGVLISNDSVILYPNAGVYTVLISDNNGCQVSSDPYTFESSEFNVSVFPNPTNSLFNVIFSLPEEQNFEISIVNTLGQVIHKENHSDYIGSYNNTFNMTNEAKSIYFLKIKGDQINFITRIALQ